MSSDAPEHSNAEQPGLHGSAVGSDGTDDDERLLTAAEIAQLLTVKESWVREQTRRGLIPHVVLGRYKRYRRAAILAWTATQEHQPQSS